MGGLSRALERNDFDCFLLAGRYTLEQEALDKFLPLCENAERLLLLAAVSIQAYWPLELLKVPGIIITGAS